MEDVIGQLRSRVCFFSRVIVLGTRGAASSLRFGWSGKGVGDLEGGRRDGTKVYEIRYTAHMSKMSEKAVSEFRMVRRINRANDGTVLMVQKRSGLPRARSTA
jgi:hypothetical protein